MPDHTLDEKPDSALIDNYRSHLKEIWQNTHNKWESVYDAYYFRTYDIWDTDVEKAEKRPDWLKPARPTSIVDHAVDHQLSAKPQLHRFPSGDGEEHQKNADLTEQGLTAIMEEAALLEPALVWKSLGKYLVHYGYAVQEIGLDSRVLSKRNDEPKRKSSEDDDEWSARQRIHQHYRRTAMPFRIRAPHPSDVLIDPSEKRPQIAIKHTKRYSIHLHETTTSRKKRGRKVDVWDSSSNPWELILVDEFWSEYWHALMASGHVNQTGKTYDYTDKRLLFVEPNTWGFVPYAHAFSNFGMEKTNSESRGPDNLAVGILDPVIADLRAQAQAVSGRHNALIDATFNKLGAVGIGAEDVRNQLDSGDILELPDRGSLFRLEIPQLPRWMFMTEEWLARDIEEGTVSRAIAGIREQGVSTVGQQAILSTAAGRKFTAVAQQMEHLASVAASQILQLVDILDLDLTIRGHRIRPDYIEHDYSVQVSFDLIDPVIQLQQREMGLREVQLGLKSHETYRSADARLEDEVGERKRLLTQWIRSNPLIHQALAMEVAREEGIDRLLERAIQLSEAAQSNGAGNGPGIGNGLGNGAGTSALLGPDGQPLSQSMGQTGGAPQAVEQLRNALTPNTISPGRRGVNLAG